jgi:Cytochrome c
MHGAGHLDSAAVTDVPEHLLRRSRERREALGLGGDAPAPTASDEAPAAPAAPAQVATPAGVDGPAEVGAEVAEAPAAAAPARAGGRPATITAEPAVYALPETPRRVPIWMMPVLVGLPFWAIVYMGAFSSHVKTTVNPLVLGQQVYNSVGCAGCHGASGGGGVGPALHGGQSKLTFPNMADQISWVKTGSAPFAGKPYGDPKRPGGQHGPAKGIMPAFAGTLSDEQINAVVLYERLQL